MFEQSASLMFSTPFSRRNLTISSGLSAMSMFLSILWKPESGSKVSMAHSLYLCVSMDCSPFLIVSRNFLSFLLSSGGNWEG